MLLIFQLTDHTEEKLCKLYLKLIAIYWKKFVDSQSSPNCKMFCKLTGNNRSLKYQTIMPLTHSCQKTQVSFVK